MQDYVKNCWIHYDGRCPSDHFPVKMELEVVPQLTCALSGSMIAQSSNAVKWSSLTDDNLSSYELLMEELLDSIHIPTGILHGDKYFFNESHLVETEHYF